jgi:DNA polymerase IIIc chi subunit
MKTCLFHDTSAALHDRRVFEIVEDVYNSQGKALIFAESDKRAAEIDRALWIIRSMIGTLTFRWPLLQRNGIRFGLQS